MNHVRTFALGLALLDVVATVLVFNLASWLRGVTLSEPLLLQQLAVPIIALVVAIYLVQGYKLRTDLLSVDYASQHTIAVAGAMLATLLLTFVIARPGVEIAPQSSRVVIGVSFLALIPVTLLYRRLLHLRQVAARGERSLVFVGDRESCDAFQAEFRKMHMHQRLILSLAADAGDEATALPARPFGAVLDDIEQKRVDVEAIVLRESARELTTETSQRLVQLHFAGVPTYTLELFHQIYWQKIPLYRLNPTWLFQEGFPITREPVFERLKRLADIVLALLGLLLATPLLLAAALAIWMEDRGPIFFRQTRVGRNRVPFSVFKLRSMRADPGGALYTQPGDKRITRIGHFLRTSRLDELPQLWNVLRGDMSLIGPRAEWARLVENYEREIPSYHFRHLVKPGITGWAQVNYPYGANLEDTMRKLEYDLYYIRHFSFVLDATIVLKTIHVMLFGKGR